MKCAILLGLFCVLPAWAARPFVTDDARLTAAGSCQLETWTRQYHGSREYWALPACNPGGNLEITLGMARASNQNSGAHSSDLVLQFKTLFKPLTRNDWGAGLAVGQVRHQKDDPPGPNQLGTTYAYVPLSLSLRDDRVIVHTNVGWLNDKASGRDHYTWGLGAEYTPGSPRLAWIAEAYGDGARPGRPYWQAGLRYSLVPNLLQIDTSYGSQYTLGTAGRWLSLGLRWTPARLF